MCDTNSHNIIYNEKIVSKYLEDILSEPKYKVKNNDNLISLISKQIDKALNWFFDKLGDILPGGVVSYLGESTSKVLAVLVIIAFFVVVSLLLIKKLNANIIKSEKHTINSSEYIEELKKHDFLIKQAAIKIETGDIKKAFSLVYLACISYLAEKSILSYDPSKTNWEYIREMDIKGRQNISNLMKSLSLLFDKKIYGRENIKVSDYENALEIYSRVSNENS
ncbi:MAG: hypothetical protein SNJ71_02610 [Bacteroidales bacterium]